MPEGEREYSNCCGSRCTTLSRQRLATGHQLQLLQQLLQKATVKKLLQCTLLLLVWCTMSAIFLFVVQQIFISFISSSSSSMPCQADAASMQLPLQLMQVPHRLPGHLVQAMRHQRHQQQQCS
jgi:hypothetical protein